MAGTDPLPVRSRIKIDFTRLDALLSNFFLVEVIDGGGDYYFKYFGDLMPELCGINLCGLHLSDVTSVALRSSLKPAYDRVVRARRPTYLAGHYVRPTARIAIERLQIPVLDDDGAVAAIWGLVIPDLRGHSRTDLAGDGPARLDGNDEILPPA